HHRVISVNLARELSSHFNGFQRKVASAVAQVSAKLKAIQTIRVVKAYKPFARYGVCQNLHKIGVKFDGTSGQHGLDLLCDTMAPFFAHMKNDRRESRARDPRHVYPNPTCSEICPILAIGNVYIGPHTESMSRIPICFVEMISMNVSDRSERRGTDASYIGTHSMHKRAPTFARRDRLSNPLAVIVYLRTRRYMGGVEDMY
ncbi:hypothetical protein GN958_ATG01606, partial [Phytophthora infestans]